MQDFNNFINTGIKNLLSHSHVLVTGGAGFIGSHLCEKLLQLGVRKLTALDNLETGNIRNLENIHKNERFNFINGDIQNFETCLEACSNVDFILHQAALGSVPRSIKDPIQSNNVNIGGFVNILKAASDQKVKRVVYAASSSTYGDSKKLPKQEHTIGRPLSPYAVTKLVNEIYADVWKRVYNLDSIGLRYFNVFGPRQNPNGPYAAVIPNFIQNIILNEPVFINGDGLQTRDFTYVDNVVYANILSLSISNEEALNRVYNIAYGSSTSLNILFEKIKSNIDISFRKLNYREERQGDVRDSLADISLAKEYLGYNPIIDLNEGLDFTCKWFKDEASK